MSCCRSYIQSLLRTQLSFTASGHLRNGVSVPQPLWSRTCWQIDRLSPPFCSVAQPSTATAGIPPSAATPLLCHRHWHQTHYVFACAASALTLSHQYSTVRLEPQSNPVDGVQPAKTSAFTQQRFDLQSSQHYLQKAVRSPMAADAKLCIQAMNVITNNVDKLSSADSARVVWALGKLCNQLLLKRNNADLQRLATAIDSCVTQQLAVPSTARDTLASHRNWNAIDLCQLMYGFALLSIREHPSPKLQQCVLARAVARCQEFESRELATLLYALGKLQLPKQAVQESVGTLLRRVYQELWSMLPQDIAQVMWALARMELKVSVDFLDAVMEVSQRKAESFGPQDFSNLMWALAHLKCKILLSFERSMLTHAHLRLNSFTPQNINNFMSALPQLKAMPPADFMDKLFAVAKKKLHRFSPQDISGVLWALAKLGCPPPPGFANRLMGAARQKLNDFEAQDHANVIWALAEMRCDVAPEFLGAVHKAAKKKFSSFNVIDGNQLRAGLKGFHCKEAQEFLADFKSSAAQRARKTHSDPASLCEF